MAVVAAGVVVTGSVVVGVADGDAAESRTGSPAFAMGSFGAGGVVPVGFKPVGGGAGDNKERACHIGGVFGRALPPRHLPAGGEQVRVPKAAIGGQQARGLGSFEMGGKVV